MKARRTLRAIRLATATAACVGAALVAVACSTGKVELCGQIPGRGCPIGRGGSCDDQSCSGLYDCTEGSWRLVTACPANGASQDEVRERPICADAPDWLGAIAEAGRCTPDLQHPDCPLAAARSCDPCVTGCIDFFACTSDAWTAVAFCDGEGKLHPAP
ncbi:MAG: hypothetical protein HY908_33675 [Myxococcales bacterium]|nr:hypothetical protein [Myxococcales bacterium]